MRAKVFCLVGVVALGLVAYALSCGFGGGESPAPSPDPQPSRAAKEDFEQSGPDVRTGKELVRYPVPDAGDVPDKPVPTYPLTKADRQARAAILFYAEDQGIVPPSLHDLSASKWEAIRSLVDGSKGEIEKLKVAQMQRVLEIAQDRAASGLLPLSTTSAVEVADSNKPRRSPPRREHVGQLVASVYQGADQYVCRVGPGEDERVDSVGRAVRERVDLVLAGVRQIVSQ